MRDHTPGDQSSELTCESFCISVKKTLLIAKKKKKMRDMHSSHTPSQKNAMELNVYSIKNDCI